MAAPAVPKTSKPSAFGRPHAILDTENVPVAPPANVAVNVAMSSLPTGSRSWLTATPAACPTAAPSGTGRSGIMVDRTVPRTLSTGPHRNSPTSTRWVPMSARAPDPGSPR